jgi:hypothetical protein
VRREVLADSGQRLVLEGIDGSTSHLHRHTNHVIDIAEAESEWVSE